MSLNYITNKIAVDGIWKVCPKAGGPIQFSSFSVLNCDRFGDRCYSTWRSSHELMMAEERRNHFLIFDEFGLSKIVYFHIVIYNSLSRCIYILCLGYLWMYLCRCFRRKKYKY